MKFYYWAILFLASGALVLTAQTNVSTNTVVDTNAVVITKAVVNTNAVNAILALVTTNSPPPPTNLPAAPKTGMEKITIHSDGPSYIDLNGRWTTYQDHVSAAGSQWKMTCEWLMANLPQTGGPTNIVAQTNVVGDFTDDRNQKWHVTGEKGVYDFHVQNGMTNETVTLTGNPPTVEEGPNTNTMIGDAIIYDVVTKRVTIRNPTANFWRATNAPTGTNKNNSFLP